MEKRDMTFEEVQNDRDIMVAIKAITAFCKKHNTNSALVAVDITEDGAVVKIDKDVDLNIIAN